MSGFSPLSVEGEALDACGAVAIRPVSRWRRSRLSPIESTRRDEARRGEGRDLDRTIAEMSDARLVPMRSSCMCFYLN